ncbi:hypothetical protein L0F63_006465 [Massospora cicadina]|nr:hypothetical protein L0F63_006465 [Massospora cicadina]
MFAQREIYLGGIIAPYIWPEANATLYGLFYEAVPLLQHLILDAYNALVDTNAPTKAALFDGVDEFLLLMIAACCFLALGTYDANQVKLSPDSFLCHLDNCTLVTASVQLYKRAAKVVTVTHLQSHSADLSPVEDAIAYFSEVFSQPNPQLLGIDPGMAANYRSPADEFLHYFSPEKMLKQMWDYLQSMSYGEDSIHIKILLMLLPCGISGILSQFFQLCLWCGITPTRWNTSVVCPIPKKKTSAHINAFHPIALMVMFQQLFEKCLLVAFE